MLTFNPGWDRTGSTLSDFDDVRDIQRTLKSRGLVPTAAADESSTGPASLVLTDPDGNPILIDQHVKHGGSQFIIATHSPILMAYPNAIIYQLSAEGGISPIAYEDTEHVRVTRDFLNNREAYLRELFTE